MRKIIFVLAFLSTSLLFAQTKHLWNDGGIWSINASYWDTKDLDSDVGIGSRLDFAIVPNVYFDFRISWYQDVAGNTKQKGKYTDLEVIPFEAGMLIQKPISPIFTSTFALGVGYYVFDANIITDNNVKVGVDPDDEFGFYGSLGFEYLLSKNVDNLDASAATIFLELMYRDTNIKDVNVDNLTYRIDEVDLSGLVVNFGIILRWE